MALVRMFRVLGNLAALLPPADDDDYEKAEFTMETRDAPPSHLLIKIESFSSLPEYGIQDYKSREFAAGDYKWRLTVYLHGGHISADVAMAGSSSLPLGWQVNAFFSICFFNQILGNYLCFKGKLRRFNAVKPKWGLSNFMSKKSLRDPCNGFLVDDNCVFGAEVFVVKSQIFIDCVSVLKPVYPFKRDWTISNFSKLEGVWTSQEFTAGGQKWKIKLYPNGDEQQKGQNVSIYLYSVDSKKFVPHEKVKADFCFCIKNQLHDNHLCGNYSQWFTSSEPSWGWSAFIPVVDMHEPSKGFIVNDCCLLEVEISVQVVARNET